MSDIEKGHGSTMTSSPRAIPGAYIANPGPLGLLGFASTTFILSFYNVAVDGIMTPNVVVGMALFYGGLAQLLAGMWEYPRGNTFGATAFASYGAFWISFATIFWPGSGILTAYTDPNELNKALGIYLWSWFIVTSIFLIVSLRKSIGFIALLFFLDLTFLFLAAGKFTTNVNVTKAGGGLGIVTAFIAYYIGLSDMLAAERAAVIGLPVGCVTWWIPSHNAYLDKLLIGFVEICLDGISPGAAFRGRGLIMRGTSKDVFDKRDSQSAKRFALRRGSRRKNMSAALVDANIPLISPSGQFATCLSFLAQSPMASANSEPVNIIVDDTLLFAQPNTVLGNPNTGNFWTLGPDDFGFPARYNDTVLIIQSDFGKDGWFFSFDGAAVALYGITPPLSFNQTIGFSAFPFDTNSDLSTANPATFPATKYAQPAFGGQIYRTPTLSTGASAIEVGFTGASGIVLDYAVVTVGNLTDLRGQTVILDDTSSEVFWSGDWAATTDSSVDVPCFMPFDTLFNDNGTTPFTATMHPYENTTHQSSNVGDAFIFQFSGAAPLVSGITPSSDSTGSDWLLSMSFTLFNGTSTTPTSSIITNFTRDVTDSTRPQFVYFSDPLLESGDHTLVAKILAVAGATSPLPQAQIDFITYLPAFQSASQKASFDPGANAAALLNAAATAASNASTVAASATGSSTSTVASAGGGASSSNHAGAIAGGVVGGLGFILIVLLVLFWFLRRRMKRRDADDMSGTYGNPTFVRPFAVYSSQGQNQPLGSSSTQNIVTTSEGDNTQSYSHSSSAPLVYEPYVPAKTGTSAGSTTQLSPLRTVTTKPESIRTVHTTETTHSRNSELQLQMRELQTQVQSLTQQLRGGQSLSDTGNNTRNPSAAMDTELERRETVTSSLPPSYRRGTRSDAGFTESESVRGSLPPIPVDLEHRTCGDDAEALNSTDGGLVLDDNGLQVGPRGPRVRAGSTNRRQMQLRTALDA
uniref:Gpr1 family protein n=1 Tax=Mycena chlorophos TaxID=658473 RepID=A0ABQ0LXI6_MYCCL|nr:Gpr1 family protein [Mycena chlorophos]